MKYAYTKKDGKINNKFAVPDLGTINKDSYDEIVEVQTGEELKAVEVYIAPHIKTEKEVVEDMIMAEKRKIAIDSLKNKGELEEVDGKYKIKKQV